MANRRFEMHEHRHVIHRMRLGESDRGIAKSGLMGRLKCSQLREVAIRHGWLGDGPLPDSCLRFVGKKQPISGRFSGAPSTISAG